MGDRQYIRLGISPLGGLTHGGLVLTPSSQNQQSGGLGTKIAITGFGGSVTRIGTHSLAKQLAWVVFFFKALSFCLCLQSGNNKNRQLLRLGAD